VQSKIAETTETESYASQKEIHSMGKRVFSFLMFISLIFAASVFSCAPQQTGTVYMKGGKEYGKIKSGTFRHRWWNYYERGLSYADGEFYSEAISDLKEAIRQREKDQRRARTYGMHFIDYFPHRELGVVYYQSADFLNAKKELELSLNQFPSAKAHFYIDNVRKKLIEHKQKEVPPPRLDLDIKTQELLTRADPVVLSGAAEDENYIKGLKINKIPLFMDESRQRIKFQKDLSLPQGRHVIEIEAENLVGKVSRRQLVIIVDREGPIITLEQIKVEGVLPEKQAFIQGTMYDHAGVSELQINGRVIALETGVEVPFMKTLSVAKDELAFIAKDSLGNQTTAQVSLDAFSIHKTAPVMLAWAGSDQTISALLAAKDTQGPVISLKAWTASQTVFLEKIYLEGQVSDQNKIINISINQKPILRREGNIILFSQFVELTPGENKVHIRARDESGNAAEKIISITRKIPKALQLNERLSTMVLPFEQAGDLSQVSTAFQDFMISALVNQDRFRVVERNKLDVLLEEQKRSQTELFDQKTAITLGRLIAAHTILAGSIIQTRTGIEIVARLIDTETSMIMATADVYDENSDMMALNALSEGLAIKFHREFPLVNGLVIKTSGNNIFTDLGTGKTKLQRRLIVYREEPIKHPVTGKLLGSDNVILGRVRVVQVMPELSKAEILDPKADSIKQMDKVITE
jgi:TolB-like protein